MVLLELAPVLAMAAFSRDAPPVARRPWLLALPACYLLVGVPMLVPAIGESAWLPDSPGLYCILVSLACLAHAPRAGSRQAAGSGVWSLTLAELLVLTAAVALVAPDAARAQADVMTLPAGRDQAQR